MRRELLLSVVVALVFGAWTEEGCSPTAPQSFVPDTGLLVFDSAIPPLVYDGGPEPVRVVAASVAGPLAGAMVVFHDASGNVIGQTTTDAEGHAEHLLPAGTAVTVLMGNAVEPLAVTYLDVEPGDLLVAYDTTIFPFDNPITIPTIPPTPPPATNQYEIFNGACSQYVFSAPIDAYPNQPLFYCVNAIGQVPLLLEALDLNYAPVGFVFEKGETLDVDAGTTVDISGLVWSTASSTWTVNLTNAQSSLPDIDVSEVASFVPLPTVTFPQGTGDGGVAPTLFNLHPGYADFIQSEVRASNSGSFTTFTVIATRSPAPSGDGSVTFDLSQMPPVIDKFATDYTTNPAQPSVTFQPQTPINAPVGTVVMLNWYNPIDGGMSTNNNWMIIAPPNLTTINTPALPSSAALWAPNASSSSQPTTLTVMSGGGLASYADFRRVAAALPTANFNYLDNNTPIAPMLPIDGTLMLTAIGPNDD